MNKEVGADMNKEMEGAMNKETEAAMNKDVEAGMSKELDAGIREEIDLGMHQDVMASMTREAAATMSQAMKHRLDTRAEVRKVAILTGAAAGIGAATALLLAHNGYNLLLNYHSSQAEAEATRERCLAAGASVELGQGDICDDGVCRWLAERAVHSWGRIDLLVNNAGRTVFTGLGNWDVLTTSQFSTIYAVNAVAPFQMVRACLPVLSASSGNIVNVSSAAGVLGRGSSVPYLMSKGALNSLTLYLARSLAPAVRVNAVCPGLVTTRWFREGLGDEGYGEVRNRYERLVPLARANTPEDVAAAVFWLATAARTVTGELLMLDSGLHLGAGR